MTSWKNVDIEEKQKDDLLAGHRSGMVSGYSGKVGETLDQNDKESKNNKPKLHGPNIQYVY